MSLPPNSAAYVFVAHNEQQESFHNFFQSWIIEQDRHLHELLTASKTESSLREDQERVLRPLIERVVQHYEEYYRAKYKWSKEDVLTMLSPSWTSSLEDAFMWIGGWRPTMAFHLLYSKSGMQMEGKLAEIIAGFGTGDLGDLSPSQLGLVDQLQRKTIKDEKYITEKMAKHQETLADSSMVELSHIVTALRNGEVDEQRVDSTLAPKEEGLQKVLEIADGLRLKTLKGVINILKPIQAIHFLIAAAELHLRIHEWGMKRDEVANHVAKSIPSATESEHPVSANPKKPLGQDRPLKGTQK